MQMLHHTHRAVLPPPCWVDSGPPLTPELSLSSSTFAMTSRQKSPSVEREPLLGESEDQLSTVLASAVDGVAITAEDCSSKRLQKRTSRLTNMATSEYSGEL